MIISRALDDFYLQPEARKVNYQGCPGGLLVRDYNVTDFLEECLKIFMIIQYYCNGIIIQQS